MAQGVDDLPSKCEALEQKKRLASSCNWEEGV
jgi:hypothetical protein